MWAEDKIQEAIHNMVITLGMNRFPTHSEIQSFYGNRALVVQISRSGGTRHWAKKMNLPIKQCESEVGNGFELKAIEDIRENTGFESYQTKPRYPYDLVVSQNIRVDVKVSHPVEDKNGVSINTFNLEKKDPTCDIFILYCLRNDGEISKILIVPACLLKGKTQIGVGMLSKWDCYQNKWEYFNIYEEFYESILGTAVVLNRRRTRKENLNW